MSGKRDAVDPLRVRSGDLCAVDRLDASAHPDVRIVVRATEYLPTTHNAVTVGGMDLTSPLHSLIPTLDSAVLEVLAGTESSLSLTRVTRLAPRGSRPGLALAMDRLVEQGLVLATPANRGDMYRLNRDHVLADAVVSASRARSAILARIGEDAARMEPRPVHVSVFGSFARREAGPASDIDVLFVMSAAHQTNMNTNTNANAQKMKGRSRWSR